VRRTLSRTLTFALAVAGVFGAAEAARAQKAVVLNPDFDKDISSWKVPVDTLRAPAASGSARWSSEDAGNRGGSGSLEIRTLAPASSDFPAPVTYAAGQCMLLPSPAEYAIFGGRIRVPPSQPVKGWAELWIDAFSTTDCSGDTNPWGPDEVSNSDAWAEVAEVVDLTRAKSIRLVAAVTRDAEEAGGAPEERRADFHAFFDAVFVRLISRTERPELPGTVLGLSETGRFPPSSHRWGRHTVEGPTLVIEPNARRKEQGAPGMLPTYTSRDSIDLVVHLKHRYPFDDPQRYPLARLRAAEQNVEYGSPRPPNLEVELRRLDDPQRLPRLITLTSQGSGTLRGDPHVPLAIHVVEPSDYRVKFFRALWDCLTGAARQRSPSGGPPPTPWPTPTDEQLLTGPLAPQISTAMPGDYEVVARYYSPGGGFWHEPVFSEPVRIRVVEAEPPCPKPPDAPR